MASCTRAQARRLGPRHGSPEGGRTVEKAGATDASNPFLRPDSLDDPIDDAQALPDAPVEGGKLEVINLVPYGCTKFRISMFRVTDKAWRREHKETEPKRLNYLGAN
jgi:hypothetical protein